MAQHILVREQALPSAGLGFDDGIGQGEHGAYQQRRKQELQDPLQRGVVARQQAHHDGHEKLNAVVNAHPRRKRPDRGHTSQDRPREEDGVLFDQLEKCALVGQNGGDHSQDIPANQKGPSTFWMPRGWGAEEAPKRKMIQNASSEQGAQPDARAATPVRAPSPSPMVPCVSPSPSPICARGARRAQHAGFQSGFQPRPQLPTPNRKCRRSSAHGRSWEWRPARDRHPGARTRERRRPWHLVRSTRSALLTAKHFFRRPWMPRCMLRDCRDDQVFIRAAFAN